jgi:hypothetical protein
MDKYDLLVVNGLVVTTSDTAQYDIAIKDGKIALLAPQGSLSQESSIKVIDAKGGYVMVCESGDTCCLFHQNLSDFHNFDISLVALIAMFILKNLLFSEAKGEAVIPLRLVRVAPLLGRFFFYSKHLLS